MALNSDVYEFMAKILSPETTATLMSIPSEHGEKSNLLKDIIKSFISYLRKFFEYEGVSLIKGKRTLFHDVIEAIYNNQKPNSDFNNSVSKVVDENGEPKVMFRTDGVNKTVMGRGDGGSFFATDNLAVAGSYASKEAGLYKGFVSLKNPYIIKGESHGFFFEYKGKETTVQKAQSSLIEEGYDGVYFERTWDVGDRVNVGRDYWANNVAMFNPNQFKSATDNNGEFSTEDNRIRNSNIPLD
jgi:hypothetical protein